MAQKVPLHWLYIPKHNLAMVDSWKIKLIINNMNKKLTRKDFIEWGRIGGKVKAENYRKYIIDELRKHTTKQELDNYLSFKTGVLQEILIHKRDKKYVTSN